MEEKKKTYTIKIWEPSELMTHTGVTEFMGMAVGHLWWKDKVGKEHWTNCPYRVDEE